MNNLDLSHKESEVANSENTWVQVVNDINYAESELNLISVKLNSWRVRLRNFLGIIADAEDLNAKQRELTDKVIFLSKRLEELNEEKERKSRLEQISNTKITETFNLQEKQKYTTEYRTDRNFFDRTIKESCADLSVDMMTADQKEQLYLAADKMTALIISLVMEDDPSRVWTAWRIIDKARDVAFADGREYIVNSESGKIERDEIKEDKLFNNNKKYFSGAKRAISDILDGMPYFQGLIMLYAARDYAKVNWYIEKIFSLPPKDDEAVQGLVYALAADINDYTERLARIRLANIVGFSQLPNDVQQELIQQQAYISRLDFDLLFINSQEQDDGALNDIKKCTNNLQNSIKKAIYENTTYDECVQTRLQIQQYIADREAQIRSLWFKEQLTQQPYLSIGMGLGLAWIVGAGLPTAALMAGGFTVLKAHVESSHLRMRIPDIDESKLLSANMLPMAFDDLQQFDAFWGRGLKIPLQQTRVEIRALHEEVKNLFTSTDNRISRKILWPIAFMYGAQVVAATLIFAAAGINLPFVWPVFAALGVVTVGGITYAAGKSILDNVDLPNTTVYKMAAAVVNAIDFFIISPVKYIYNKVKNWVFRPSKSILQPEGLNLNFDLLPEAIKSLEDMSRGLASQLSDHFKQRAKVLQEKIADTNKKHQAGADIIPLLHSLNAEYSALQKDWQSLIVNVHDKGAFCKVADSYLESRYNHERQEFISVATEVGQEAKRQQLILSDMNKLKVGDLEGNEKYHSELHVMQDLCSLKGVIDRVKASL